MKQHWKWNRDGGWYADQSVTASATLYSNAVPSYVAIEDISFSGVESPEESLLRLLLRTQHEFPGMQIQCAAIKCLQPILNSLAAKGRLKWELIQHPHSQSVVIESIKQK